MQLSIKLVLNSIYGKTGQKVNRVVGNLFDPVIFAFITGHTRAELYRFITENNLETNVVSFATDSICTTNKLDFNSNRLGEVSLDNSASDVFYLQNGNLNADRKRFWLGRIESVEDKKCNDSLPISLSQFGKEEI